jgi:Cellulase (glycosyl hydrolase family 5)
LLFGINFHGFKCATYQNRPNTPTPPNSYIDDSFRIFSQAGIKCIRFPVYWESYEKNPEDFNQEIDDVSDMADKYDISCIYDNHQWECSSYLGYGIGFPNSILSQAFQRNHLNEHSQNAPSHEDLEKFWNVWWDDGLKNNEGKSGWDAQLDYFKSIIKIVNHKKSTIGFEMLNEPQVFRQGDFKNVGSYHNYILRNLNTITDKILFLCYTNSASFNAINLPTEQARTVPSNSNLKKKIIFDVHPYPPSFLLMEYYKMLSSIIGNTPLYVGEFNAGIKKGITINEKQFNEYVKRLKDFSIYGGAFWEWSYVPDDEHPAFNLTQIRDNKIYPNASFESLSKSIKENSN